MAYRKSMGAKHSRKNFRKNTTSKKINHIQGRGMRGGIRL